MEDERFASLAEDVKLRRPSKGNKNVKIGKRFQSMYKQKQFISKQKVDSRGRPIRHTTEKDLKKYYRQDSDSEGNSSSESDAENDRPSKNKSDKSGSESEEAESETADDAAEQAIATYEAKEDENKITRPSKREKQIPKKVEKKLRNLRVDYARGESNLFSGSSSSDDDESEGEVPSDEEIEHKWGELDKDAEQTENPTYRLAACNMNWDRIRAVDLMVLFNSFLPLGGVVKSVTIYPSEFGKQRMKEEEVRGPMELVNNSDQEVVDDETGEGARYHMEKLRKYQLNRLKYYYAVVVFDSAASANKIYTECDGMEYESSATKLDLRFIPDDMDFDDDESKERCDVVPEKERYQPRFFTTTALQQAKVDLTWDETDPNRLEVAEKLKSGKIDDITNAELQNIVAVSSEDEDSELEQEKDEGGKKTEYGSDDEEDEEDKSAINKYKLLLQEIEEKEKTKKEKHIGMEATFDTSDLKETTEKLVKKKLEGEDKTPFQKLLDKKKEKRLARKMQRDNSDDDSSDDIPSDIDMNNPYFAEEFEGEEFKKKSKDKKKQKNKRSANEEYDDHERDDENTEDMTGILGLLGMNENELAEPPKQFSRKEIVTALKNKGKKIKKKRKRRNEEDTLNNDVLDDVELEDERFSAVFTSHMYAPNITHSRFDADFLNNKKFRGTKN